MSAPLMPVETALDDSILQTVMRGFDKLLPWRNLPQLAARTATVLWLARGFTAEVKTLVSWWVAIYAAVRSAKPVLSA